MKHPETKRIVPGAKHAVLFLHGIVGTPNHFRRLIPLEELVPPGWSVYNLRYPGHGGEVQDFSRSNMNQWRSYAREAFLELAKNHEQVFIVGHSMGTLFAIQLALEFPEKVSGLFLLAVPLRPWVRLFCAINCLRLAFGRIRQDHCLEASLEIACGVTPTPMVWRYFPWIPRMPELFGEIHRTEKVLGRLNVPCIAWQSDKDDLVSSRSTKLLRRSGVVQVRELPNSAHFYYDPQEAAVVCTEFQNRMQKISG